MSRVFLVLASLYILGSWGNLFAESNREVIHTLPTYKNKGPAYEVSLVQKGNDSPRFSEVSLLSGNKRISSQLLRHDHGEPIVIDYSVSFRFDSIQLSKNLKGLLLSTTGGGEHVKTIHHLFAVKETNNEVEVDIAWLGAPGAGPAENHLKSIDFNMDGSEEFLYIQTYVTWQYDILNQWSFDVFKWDISHSKMLQITDKKQLPKLYTSIFGTFKNLEEALKARTK